MTRPIPERFTDAQRMELRSYVQLAGEVIAQFWPMRTFIHHNPLHGLESLAFEQAVDQGRQLFGGRGYLSNHEYRRYLHHGRITVEDLRVALQPLTVDKQIIFGGRPLSHLDVLTTAMIHGLADGPPASNDGTPPQDSPSTEAVFTWLRETAAHEPLIADGDRGVSGSSGTAACDTLGAWCDRTLGTTIVETINRELIKWCSAFLDEGEASWAMPKPERGFYRVWRSLAQHDLTLRLIGIRDAVSKLRGLPDRPEDAVLDSLTTLGIPKSMWERYLAQHLAALPGWTGYIKWRAHQGGDPWQQTFPVDLVKYLAIRLFYERELVELACRSDLGIPGRDQTIRQYMEQYPFAYRLRRAWITGQVPEEIGPEIRRLLRHANDHQAWDALGRRHDEMREARAAEQSLRDAAALLIGLAQALSIPCAAIESTPPSDLRILLGWLRNMPASQQGPVWLTAFEAGHRRQVLEQIAQGLVTADPATSEAATSRPLAQVIFCIDVRSEVFRRHLEHLGGYETLGLAGFFGVPLDFQSFGVQQTVAHCPVLLKPKNQVREIPRSYHGALAERHKSAAHLSRAAHELLHDLKENVVTPYVMVEAIGWLFSLPFFGRTLFPVWYGKTRRWLTQVFKPSIATTLTVEKLARDEADEMIAAEQQAVIRAVVRERFGLTGAALSATLLDNIRRKAVGQTEGIDGDIARALQLTPDAEAAFFNELRETYRISARGISERLDRLTHTGFSVVEQAYFVEAALRLMGLTANFARVVLFCAHGSTSQNNPYESALDCGACGGNHGLPNARTIAAMANKPAVRELLRARGVSIPNDTQFLAAEHDTTTDAVRIADLEDLPATHRKDLQRLISDLTQAGRQTALERTRWLPQTDPAEPRGAQLAAHRRSEDWAEVRPEWGLSRNSLIIIGRRALTQRISLEGRAFLHSYDHAQDASGKLLETIMTAPLVVAQWINMEHYFSTVDNDVYGSGSKVYHNVVGRIGVISGVSSDLRIGLPAQTVLNGPVPFHEPMRLLAVIEAPKERIRNVIQRHPLLAQLFNLGWVTLVALDPQDRQFYRYDPRAGWTREH